MPFFRVPILMILSKTGLRSPLNMHALSDIFNLDHAGPEKPLQKNKSTTGRCCPVQHKITVLFMKIAGNAQGFHHPARQIPG